LENVIEAQRVDGSVWFTIGQDLSEHGNNEPWDSASSLKEDTHTLLADALHLFGPEVMFDKRGQFVKGQPRKFLPYDDTSPQGSDALKPVP
jgi:hypothetical protein